MADAVPRLPCRRRHLYASRASIPYPYRHLGPLAVFDEMGKCPREEATKPRPAVSSRQDRPPIPSLDSWHSMALSLASAKASHAVWARESIRSDASGLRRLVISHKDWPTRGVHVVDNVQQNQPLHVRELFHSRRFFSQVEIRRCRRRGLRTNL